MQRLFPLLLLFLASLPLACRSFAESPPAFEAPPNVVFLYTDDQAADTLSAYGSRAVRTPNMDRVVRAGTSFSRAYCQGSWHGAVCIPSRAMTLSGRRLGRVHPALEDLPTLPEHLRTNGYTTFATGKWHNGKAALKRVFDRGHSVFFGGMCDHEEVPLHDWNGTELVDRGVGPKFSSELFADAAVDYIESEASEGPFFCWVAFTAPHDPRQPKPEWVDRTLPAAGELPPNYLPVHPFRNGDMWTRDEKLCAWPRTPQDVSDSRREYAAMIEHLDAQVGRILDAIERRDDAANTIVVLASDHGLAVGSHGLMGKQSLYEHSQRAVCALSGPGVPRGEERDAIVGLYDLAPTLAGLCGVPPLEDTDGVDLAPVLADPKARVRDGFFTRYAKSQRAWTEEDWKLIRYPRVGLTQLFDLAHDPFEQHDLSDDPRHRERRLAMEARLRAAMAAAGDETPFTAEELESTVVDYAARERERKPDRWQPPQVVERYFR